MRSWNHRVIKGQWRHMTQKWFFEFLTLDIIHGHSKTIVTCSTRRKEHAARWNFALAPSEAKLSAITGFRHFSVLDLTSEVTGWPRSLSLYQSLLFVLWRATRSFFPRSSSSIRGETARGIVPRLLYYKGLFSREIGPPPWRYTGKSFTALWMGF